MDSLEDWRPPGFRPSPSAPGLLTERGDDEPSWSMWEELSPCDGAGPGPRKVHPPFRGGLSLRPGGCHFALGV